MEDDMIHTSIPVGDFYMVYAIIAGGVFLSDLILKALHGQKYARKVRHPRLGAGLSWKNIITKARL